MMARCINCAWFPWVPGADFSNLPAQRCHPELRLKRWTQHSANIEHSCPYFKPKDGMNNDRESTNVESTNVVDVGKMTVKQLKEYLKTAGDKEMLEALKAQEENSDNPRVTAIEAIEARLRELEEGEAS